MLQEEQPPRRLTFDEVMREQRAGATIVDCRDDIDFAAGHIRGSINVGLGGRFAEYTGEVVAAGTRIVLVAPHGHEIEARVRLARIGFDAVVGVLADPVREFLAHPGLIDVASRLSSSQLATRTDVQILDVRGPFELEGGTIPGAVTIPLAELVPRLDELDPDAPTVVYCAGGYRSSTAASVLRAAGFADVSDVLGGWSGWLSAGLPVA